MAADFKSAQPVPVRVREAPQGGIGSQEGVRGRLRGEPCAFPSAAITRLLRVSAAICSLSFSSLTEMLTGDTVKPLPPGSTTLAIPISIAERSAAIFPRAPAH